MLGLHVRLDVACQEMVVSIYCMVAGSLQCLVHDLGLMSGVGKAGLTIRATGHLPRARDIKGALDNVVDKYHVMNAVLTFLDVSTLLQLVRSKYSGRTRLSF